MPKSRQEMNARRRFLQRHNGDLSSLPPPPPPDTVRDVVRGRIEEVLMHLERAADFISEHAGLDESVRELAQHPNLKDARAVIDDLTENNVLPLEALEDAADHMMLIVESIVSAIQQKRAEARAAAANLGDAFE